MIWHQNRLVQDAMPHMTVFYVDSLNPDEQFPGMQVHEEVDWESVYVGWELDIISSEISKKYACIYLGRHINTSWISTSLVYDLVSKLNYGVDSGTRACILIMRSYNIDEDVSQLNYAEVRAIVVGPGGEDENKRFIFPEAIDKMTLNTSLGEFIAPFSGVGSRARHSESQPDVYARLGGYVNFLVFEYEAAPPPQLSVEEAEVTTELTMNLEVDRFEWSQLRGFAL